MQSPGSFPPPTGTANPAASSPSVISSIIRKQEKLYGETLKLIVSENRLSPAVRAALSSDFAGRYDSEWYGGSGYADEIIRETTGLARKLFGTKYAIVTPLSGNFCDLGVILAFSRSGDAVAMMDKESGGYPFGWEKFSRRFVPLPLTHDPLNLDAGKCTGTINHERPALTILGSSTIPFPHPVKEIAPAAMAVGKCVFDGSHVLGLIATGAYPHPLKGGGGRNSGGNGSDNGSSSADSHGADHSGNDHAQVLIGSTHKSFYGPQGGIVLTDDGDLHEQLSGFLEFHEEGGIGLVDNPHVHRIAALGAALEEMLADMDYGKRVVRNSKTLAAALSESGVPVKFGDHGFTETHQVLLDLEPGEAERYCRELEKVGVFIDIGGRVGTAELTHCGLGESEMEEIAGIMGDVYRDKGDMEKMKNEVRRLAGLKRI